MAYVNGAVDWFVTLGWSLLYVVSAKLLRP
jgi:hypothetical protein